MKPFIKAKLSLLSIIIAIYFLSTIVADQIASAIFILSTNASPLYFHTFPCDLIASIFNINSKYMAVEVNNSIVPKSEYSNFSLKENDKVEIINAVGGG